MPRLGSGSEQELPRRIALDSISDHLFKALRGENNLVFGGSRRTVESAADRLRRRSEKLNVPNEFYPHYGSLSKVLREELEDRLKDGNLPTTAICTSTLELGVDIGSVKSVAQIRAPRSLASLRQRLGRTGRRRGTPSVLRIYLREPNIDQKSGILVTVFERTRLGRSRWFDNLSRSQGRPRRVRRATLGRAGFGRTDEDSCGRSASGWCGAAFRARGWRGGTID
jgi:superfamily II DNA/RNA helicase